MFCSDGGSGHARPHREAQPVGLPGAVVGVLAEDDDLDLGVGGEVEGGEHLVVGRVDGVARPLVGHEALEVGPVRLGQLGPQDRVPVGPGGHRRPDGSAVTCRA